MIENLVQLAEHVGANEPTKESIAHRLYKDTECGVCFSLTVAGVVVAGYCEGFVGDCQNYELNWPFDEDVFDNLVEKVDKEGCELWDATHGCEECGTDVGDSGYRPVNKTCKGCGGAGAVF